MPKKSNKTAHVLSLLTNGSGEPNEKDTLEEEEQVTPSPIAAINAESTVALSPTILVEIQGEPKDDLISDLVKKELEQELQNQEKKDLPQKIVVESPTEAVEVPETSLSIEEELATVEDVKSEKFILEEFDEEEDSTMLAIPTPVNDYEPTVAEDAKVLHNLAEDAIRIKAPEVMKTFNMCTCQSCTYDVMAFALNHVSPLYTVTDKGHLFQKLSSYESQYGTDLTAAITKACIKVKINPNHVHPNPTISNYKE